MTLPNQQKKSYRNTRNSKQDKENYLNDINVAAFAVYGKVPPQAVDLEKAVLGAILIEAGTYERVAEILKAECFYVDAHKRIFTAIGAMSERLCPVDLLTVTEELRNRGELELIGGPYYLTTLMSNVVSNANVEAHSEIVRRKFVQRELIRISGNTVNLAFEDTTDVLDLLDQHESELTALTTGNSKKDFHSTASLGFEVIERMDMLMSNKDYITGVPTGFPILDRITNGWQSTDLIILAARPSVGKTALALNLARNAAINPYKPTPVGFFSLEMSRSQLMQRLTSTHGKIGMDKMTTGRISEVEYNHFVTTVAGVQDLPIYIDDSASINMFEFRAKARRMITKHNVGLIIIDYLQLMSEDERTGNREQQISAISRKLKATAKELNIPIIALSQMSRAIETTKREPMLSDLRESGAIEQDADMVVFASREDYQQDVNSVDPMLFGVAKLKIAKHRNGALETLKFHTDLSIQTWFEPDQYREHIGGRFNVTPIIRPLSENTVLLQQAMRNEKNDMDDLPF